MRDWSALVDAHLAALGGDAAMDAQTRAELAGHLEDAYADAVQRGCNDEDAVASALQHVPDWTHLAAAIRRAEREDDPMSRDAKTLWLPGMAALSCAAAVLIGTSRLVPSSLWADPGAALPMMAAMLLAYLLYGALGAWWSRRAGGSVATRFVAGIFPLALHLGILATVIVAAIVGNLDFQASRALGFVVIPGVALALGALPFLRDKTETRVSA